MAAPALRSTLDPFLVSASALWRLAGRSVVQRGLAYAAAGRVTGLVSDDRRLEAKVEGTAGEPYLVAVTSDGDGELTAHCSCPYDWEPFCKHGVAALAQHSGVTPAAARAARPVRESADQPEPEEYERAVRRERARREGLTVRADPEHSGPGCFVVQGRSGGRYQVELRSLHDRVNACTCPDFAGAMLGTCKHIEAVLHHVAGVSPRRREALELMLATEPRIVVRRDGTPRVALFRPPESRAQLTLHAARLEGLVARYFDADGVLRGDPLRVLPLLRDEGIAIGRDVTAHLESLARERAAVARRDEVRAWIAALGGTLPGLRATLFPYQFEGMAFLASRGRALLADDMGLGKTVQAIAAAHLLRTRGEAERVLIVCPASLKQQWADEIARFVAEPAQIVDGDRGARGEVYRGTTPFVIVNYEQVLRDGALLADGLFDVIVVDEAQRIKNWRTRTAAAVKELRAPFVFVLTGTPLENRLDDLYSVMQLVDGRALGPLWAFNEKFIRAERVGERRVTRYVNLGELRRRLRPHVLRRERASVAAQLPERTDQRYLVPLTEPQRELMLAAERQAARLAAIAASRPLLASEQRRLMAHLTRARMACNAAQLVDAAAAPGSPKLDEFERLLEDLCLDAGRKVVVFTQWEGFQRMAAERARSLGLGHVRLHGGVPSALRGDLITRFRDDPEVRVFFATDAGGVGLNLQTASVLINLDLPWNPAVLEQRIGRIHRLGQRDNVNVVLLVAADSFEQRLERVLGGKRELFDATIPPDADDESVEVPSVNVAMARALFETTPAARPAAPPAASMAAPDDAEVPVSEPTDRAENLAAVLGNRLRCVLRMPAGDLVAIVDRDDELTADAARRHGCTSIDERTLHLFESWGVRSPFAAGALVLDRRAPGESDAATALRAQRLRRRDELRTVAERKLAASAQLAAGGLGAEALVLALAGIEAALRGRAATLGKEAPTLTGLVYEVLLPAEALSHVQAAVAVHAESVARAYGDSAAAPPPELVTSVLDDARRLAGDLARAS